MKGVQQLHERREQLHGRMGQCCGDTAAVKTRGHYTQATDSMTKHCIITQPTPHTAVLQEYSHLSQCFTVSGGFSVGGGGGKRVRDIKGRWRKGKR